MSNNETQIQEKRAIAEDFARQVRQAVDSVLSQLEEVLQAFIAKHGFEPDRAIQVERRMPDGTTHWFVRQRTDEEMLAADIMHIANPLHVYCRLLDIGLPRWVARKLCILYEREVYPDILDCLYGGSQVRRLEVSMAAEDELSTTLPEKKDDEIKALKSDILTLVGRLYGESDDTFAPETQEVMRRWSPIFVDKFLKKD